MRRHPRALAAALIAGSVASSVGACEPAVPATTLQVPPVTEAGTTEAPHAPRVTSLEDSDTRAAARSSGDGPDATEALRTSLTEAGGTVHYPSIVLFDGASPWGTAVVGYKKAQGYRALLEPRIVALSEGADPASGASPGGAPRVPGARANAVTAKRPAHVEVVWRQTMNPAPGFFFRRAPGTRFISYDQRRRVILQHLETGEKLLGPSFIDFVPTPDGALFVTPSHINGLECYVASRVFSEARAGPGAAVEPVFQDPELDDQYPSVGILEDDPGVSTTYRVLVSWFAGLAVREYRVEWRDAGAATVTPTTPRIDACPGVALSTPILSKDGREIAARDEATGTTKLFRYHNDGTCTEVFDVGIPTSKVSFSDDGQRIAWSTPEGSTGHATLQVHDRERGQTIDIPEGRSRGLMIPELAGPDSLLFIVEDSTLGPGQEFRMVCCVW